MMTGMRAYYVSRAVLAVLLGALAVMTGWDWWLGLLVAALVFGWFLLAPRIGRYAVQPQAGVTALRRDELSQVINDKAARNAFVATALAMGGVLVYCGLSAVSSVPLAVLDWLLIFGVAVYY